jgi:hypothetical protein
VRRIEESVDPSPPRLLTGFDGWRELELQALPVRVDDDVKQYSFLRELCRERHAVRIVTPIRLVKSDAVPDQVGLPDQLIEGDPVLLGLIAAQHPARIERRDEPVQLGPFR